MEPYEPIGTISGKEAIERIAEWFPKQANLYAVLDFAVCFGIYTNGSFLVGLEGEKAPTPLEWKFLRELRIFDEEKELFLVPSDCGWTGRIRRDTESCKMGNQTGEYIIDERQKLWGRVGKEQKEGFAGWTLLVSERGTRIWIPVELSRQEEAAIHVRRYMRVPDVKKGEALVFQNDIRMAAFCPWEGDCEDGGKEECTRVQ